MALIDQCIDGLEPTDPAILAAMGDKPEVEAKPAPVTQALPLNEVKEVLVEGKALQDQQEVLAEVKAQGTMSRVAAEMISEKFPKFLESNVSLEEYTAQPTMTNYKHAVTEMEGSIQQSSEDILTKWVDITTKTIGTLEELSTTIDGLIELIREQISLGQQKYSDLVEKYTATKDTSYMLNGEVVDLKYSNLNEVDIASLDTTNFDKQALQANIKELFGYFNVPGIAKLFSSDEVASQVDFVSAPLNSDFNLLGVAKLLSGKHSDLLDVYVDGFHSEVATLRQAIEKSTADINAVVAYAPQVATSQSKTLKYFDYFTSLSRAYIVAEKLLVVKY